MDICDILISVIVPVYNLEKELPRCLDSILAQTHQNLQILVIDDGSTDRSPAIIDSYAQKDPRVTPIHQPNGGLVAARERGISLARGQYVGFVDGDDTIEADMYRHLLKNAVTYDADISHCGVAFCWPDGRIDHHYATGVLMVQDHIQGQQDLLEGTRVEPSLCSKLYRAELLPDSCLDPAVLNNEDLLRNFILFQRAKRSVFEDFSGYQYIQRPGSMSKDHSRRVRIARDVFRARELIVTHAEPEVYPLAMRSWLSCVVNSVNQMPDPQDPELRAYRRSCRAFLRAHRQDLHYLIPRQRLAARLIIHAPWLHRLLYQIYWMVKYK